MFISRCSCVALFLFFCVFDTTLLAQDCTLPTKVMQDMYDVGFVKSNLELIKKYSRFYSVPQDAMIYILYQERNDRNFYDWIENQLARGRELEEWELRKLVFPENIFTLYGLIGTDSLKSSQTAYIRAFAEDTLYDERSEKPKKGCARDGEDHWIFCSIGPAQIQPYLVGAMMAKKKLKSKYFWDEFVTQEGEYRFAKIAEYLAAVPMVTIEVLAAELAWAQEVYLDMLGVKISDLPESCTAYKELHRIGYFKALAKNRLQRNALAYKP